MSFTDETLTRTLSEIAVEIGAPGRYVVAFSGGMDSAVLLHALAAGHPGIPVLALHVDHGLDPESAAWEQRARDFATGLGTAYESVAAEVDRHAGKGLEAAAREARYGVFESRLRTGDWLLSAHHLDDQAETLLLNLLRGSGPLGLAGMSAARRLGPGHLVRPLLDTPRADLASYAAGAGLDWVDDPANRDPRFDRNFLRHEVMPRLAERWPEAAARLSRSAALAEEAQSLLDALAAIDWQTAATACENRLSIEALGQLGTARQRNLLRFACRRLSLPLPPASRLESVLTDILGAQPDAEPLVEWPGARVRRYRNELFLLPADVGAADFESGRLLRPGERLELGPALGSLTLERADGPGIPAAAAEAGLRVTTRAGGERLRLARGGRSQSLKKLLQAEGVLPWMRDSLPILMAGDELVAVANLWINAEFASDPGYRVVWHDQPALI